jgi:exosortase C (VPDSG-CTERM-specific)
MNTAHCSSSKTEPSLTATEEERAQRRQDDVASPRRRFFGYAAFSVILGLAFAQPLIALAVHAAQNDIHSHILLIPVISVYLILIQRSRLPKDYATSPGFASLVSVLGLAMLIAAWILLRGDPNLSKNDYLALMTFSFVCFFAAGGFLFLGRKWMAAVAFPMAFLLFMIPLPDRLLHWLETASQVASTETAAMFFAITDTPMLREGAVFQLPGIAIQVAQECSGIRSSWVLLITTLAASYLFLKSPWRRAMLILFVIPLAIVRNGFRIWSIGVLCVEMGPQMIHSAIHQQGGPLFFALSLIPLFLLLWWLRRGEQGKAHPQISPMDQVTLSKEGTLARKVAREIPTSNG